jgi:hypothetical protein
LKAVIRAPSLRRSLTRLFWATPLILVKLPPANTCSPSGATATDSNWASSTGANAVSIAPVVDSKAKMLLRAIAVVGAAALAARATRTAADKSANRTRRPMSRRFPLWAGIQDALMDLAARLHHWPGHAEIIHRAYRPSRRRTPGGPSRCATRSAMGCSGHAGAAGGRAGP